MISKYTPHWERRKFNLAHIKDSAVTCRLSFVENNIMQQPDFKYYTLEDFINNEDISQSKSMPLSSTIHFNIRILSANHDGLAMLLSD